jgi:hypothetical protein
MNHRSDAYVDNKKLEAYQLLIQRLGTEKRIIETLGPFSWEAKEAEKATIKARRIYDIWQKK